MVVLKVGRIQKSNKIKINNLLKFQTLSENTFDCHWLLEGISWGKNFGKEIIKEGEETT